VIIRIYHLNVVSDVICIDSLIFEARSQS
jgi:hypothetical protein